MIQLGVCSKKLCVQFLVCYLQDLGRNEIAELLGWILCILGPLLGFSFCSSTNFPKITLSRTKEKSMNGTLSFWKFRKLILGIGTRIAMFQPILLALRLSFLYNLFISIPSSISNEYDLRDWIHVVELIKAHLYGFISPTSVSLNGIEKLQDIGTFIFIRSFFNQLIKCWIVISVNHDHDLNVDSSFLFLDNLICPFRCFL